MFRERTTTKETGKENSSVFLSVLSKDEYMTVLHCVFFIWQILMYMNDSVVFINKRYFSTTSLLLLHERYLDFAT